MREVMTKAQELAEAILDSEVYQKMKKLEGEVRHDPEAGKLLGDMIEKRQKVEETLSAAGMKPEEVTAFRTACEKMFDNLADENDRHLTVWKLARRAQEEEEGETT